MSDPIGESPRDFARSAPIGLFDYLPFAFLICIQFGSGCYIATNLMTAYTIIGALRAGLNNSELTPRPMKPDDETMSASVAMYKRRKSVDKAAKESVMSAVIEESHSSNVDTGNVK